MMRPHRAAYFVCALLVILSIIDFTDYSSDRFVKSLAAYNEYWWWTQLASVSPGGSRPQHRPRNLCFIHVGKAGGETIQKGLKQLASADLINDFMQIHGELDRPTRDKNYTLPRGRTRHYYAYGSRRHLDDCLASGLIITWVRDPVARLVSTWNFHNCSVPGARCAFDVLRVAHELGLTRAGLGGSREDLVVDGVVDLNEALLALAAGPLQAHQTFLQHVPMATAGIAEYLGNCENLASRSGGRGRGVWFVGRTEHMDEDWEQLLRTKLGLSWPMRRGYALGHTHQTKREHGVLSSDVVRFLRSVAYAEDMACIRQMGEEGLLSRSYYATEITDAQKKYHY